MVTNELKVASVVILYNPELEVLKNIAACAEQTEIVFVLDNSDSYNQTIIDKIIIINKVEYHNFNSNLGVAYSLNYAAKLAIKNNFDFLLTMDQDSFLTPGMVDRMIEDCSSKEDVGIVSPLHRNRFRTQEIHTSIYEEVLFIKTSGNLLNLKIYQKAGPFDEDYFIDYVDIEYGMRLNMLGYKVLRVNNAVLEHSEANLSEKKFFGIKFYPWNHQPIRWYYKIRNLLYLEEKYKKHYPDFFKKEKAHYIRQFIKILLYENNKLKKIKFGFEGFKASKKKLVGIKKGVQ